MAAYFHVGLKKKGKEHKCNFKEENGFEVQHYRACIFSGTWKFAIAVYRIEK